MINLKTAEYGDEEFWLSVDSHAKRENLKRRISEKRGFIILDGKTPVGVIAYNEFWDELAFLSLIKLNPDNRHRGVGKAAMSLFEAELKKLGYSALLVSTQTDEDAQTFYRKIGYKECGCLVLDREPIKQPMEMFFIKTF